MDMVKIQYATFVGGPHDGQTEDLGDDWEITLERSGERYQCTFWQTGWPYCAFTPSPTVGDAGKCVSKALYENTCYARRAAKETEQFKAVG